LVQAQQTGEQLSVPQNARWKCHSMPFDIVVPKGTFFLVASSLKNLSTSLFIVLSRNEVRVIGVKSLGPLYKLIPGFGINTAITWHNIART